MVGRSASGMLLRLLALCIAFIFALLLAGGLAVGLDEDEVLHEVRGSFIGLEPIRVAVS
ncbi:MAG: hypothetical protein JJE48_05495 [Actinobacteria bacterium]|nr:hypothetical protein [Actinomycetota bacterium]